MSWPIGEPAFWCFPRLLSSSVAEGFTRVALRAPQTQVGLLSTRWLSGDPQEGNYRNIKIYMIQNQRDLQNGPGAQSVLAIWVPRIFVPTWRSLRDAELRTLNDVHSR